MYKQHLLNAIEKEINICKRLFSLVPKDQLHYRPKEGMRSTLELLQYLTVIGSVMPAFWIQPAEPFNEFFANRTKAAMEVNEDNFVEAMDKQLTEIHSLFSGITDEVLLNKEISFPWGSTAALGDAILGTSVKFITAYKMQLYLYLKMSTDQTLGTADAWALT